MEAIRKTAVAGTFYPAEPAHLRALVDEYLAGYDTEGMSTEAGDAAASSPKALIAPHAGYVYSGAIAGNAYRQLQGRAGAIKRVVLLGPSHRVAFRGMALPTASAYRTPLGDLPIDRAAVAALKGLGEVGFLDQAHKDEHSLEVHLPFLQQTLGDFSLLPIVVGDASKEVVARVLDQLWGGEETLVVVSSDLSHYESYEVAQQLDRATADKILALDTDLNGQQACGCRPINGLLHLLKERGLGIEEVDVRNSGDTAGDRARVVGYGAFRALGEPDDADAQLTFAQRQRLLQLAKASINSPLAGEEAFRLNLNSFEPRLRAQAASFVTLNLDGRLRGCIGSTKAHRPLAQDVAVNAQSAAFKDPRFPPLTLEEFQRVELHISVLSKPQPMAVASLEELIAALRPGKDGLIIHEDGRGATFLPSVWQQMASSRQFVTQLRRKAGLPEQGWNETSRAERYTTLEFC